jgi:hypothetical protein
MFEEERRLGQRFAFDVNAVTVGVSKLSPPLRCRVRETIVEVQLARSEL